MGLRFPASHPLKRVVVDVGLLFIQYPHLYKVYNELGIFYNRSTLNIGHILRTLTI